MSWKIGEVRGIAIRVHATFALLLLWIAVSRYSADKDVTGALVGVAFTMTVFGVVVLHELGHALVALRFGIRTKDITLLPVGGVARLERLPEDPSQELLIAIAGPIVNFAIAAVLFAGLAVLGEALVPPATLGTSGFVAKLAWTNVGLAVFNLLPAFPMDGGRVLRALLASRMERVRATAIAAIVGQVFAVLLGLFGMLANPILVLIAFFVWNAAAEESEQVRLKAALRGIPLSSVMAREFRTLSPDDTLAVAVDHHLAGFQHDFPVLEGDRVVGVLSRADLLHGVAQLGPHARVREAMRTQFATAEAEELLETAALRLAASECPALPVLRRGRLVGVFMPECVGNLLGIQQALVAKTPAEQML